MTSLTEVRTRFRYLSDSIDDMRTDLAAVAEANRTGKPRGPAFPFAEVNDEIGGFMAPGLHTLHGAPGTGKSALAQQVAETCGFPSLYVTCEMSPTVLAFRRVARSTPVNIGNLRRLKGMTYEQAVDKAQSALVDAPPMAILDATTSGAPIDEIEDAAHAVRGNSAQLLIVIDSAHTWAASLGASGESEYDRLARAVDDLCQLASRLRSPVLVIAERPKAGSGGVNGSAGHRAFGFRSEGVYELDKDDETVTDYGTPVRLKIPKNRHGNQGRSFSLVFEGQHQSFRGMGMA